MPAAIKIPPKGFDFQFTDEDTGSPTFGCPPPVLEKINQLLAVGRFNTYAGKWHANGDWTLQVTNGEIQHNLTFDSQSLGLIIPDDVIFDRVYQIIVQLYHLCLHQQFAKYRESLT